MEGPQATPVTRIAEAFRQLPLIDEALLPVQQASFTAPFDVQTSADDVCFVHIGFVRLLERYSRKMRPKTTFISYDSSNQ